MTTASVTHRICTACRESKPASEFYTSKTSGRVSGYCKPCDNAGRKSRYYGNFLPRLKPPRQTYCQAVSKFCHKCQQLKSRGDFHSNRARKDKLSIYCRPCSNKATVAYTRTPNGRAYQQRQHKKRIAKEGYRDERNARKWRERYGLSPEGYAELVARQNGVCAICGELPAIGHTLHVDHDHRTGKVRGLLCIQHNSLLGMAKDSIDILENAKQYLLAHREEKAA